MECQNQFSTLNLRVCGFSCWTWVRNKVLIEESWLSTKGLTVLEPAVGAAFCQTSFLLVRHLVLDLGLGKFLLTKSGVGGFAHWITQSKLRSWSWSHKLWPRWSDSDGKARNLQSQRNGGWNSGDRSVCDLLWSLIASLAISDGSSDSRSQTWTGGLCATETSRKRDQKRLEFRGTSQTGHLKSDFAVKFPPKSQSGALLQASPQAKQSLDSTTHWKRGHQKGGHPKTGHLKSDFAVNFPPKSQSGALLQPSPQAKQT